MGEHQGKYRLSDLRNLANMSQRQWGELLGLSESTIQKRESNPIHAKKWTLKETLEAIDHVNKVRGMSINITDIAV